MNNINPVVKKILKRLLTSLLLGLGGFFVLVLILSFTTLPFWMYYHLGAVETGWQGEPDYIVVLGGGGIPSESGLMRTYRAYEEASNYPDSKIIIALPGDVEDSVSSVNLMKEEVVWRGVDSVRIQLEPNGLNTRMQALNIKEMIDCESSIYIITSPEHTYRSVRAFSKVGFTKIYGRPAFEKALEAMLEFDDDELGGNRHMPKVGGNLNLRYQFWNHLKYQIIVYREYVAICYYKLKGWI